MREGRLGYNSSNDRYGLLSSDLWIDTGFHCGECLEVLIDDQWVQTRMEMNPAREWYLVGTPYCGDLEYIYIPDLRSTVFLPDTIPLPDSSPFWSAPTDHQLVLPSIPHNEILYQSINLMTINHIYRYCCYILIFLLSLLYAPFYCPTVRTP